MDHPSIHNIITFIRVTHLLCNLARFELGGLGSLLFLGVALDTDFFWNSSFDNWSEVYFTWLGVLKLCSSEFYWYTRLNMDVSASRTLLSYNNLRPPGEISAIGEEANTVPVEVVYSAYFELNGFSLS